MNENESQYTDGENFKARELTPEDFGVTPEVDPSEQTKVDRIREALIQKKRNISNAASLATSAMTTISLDISTSLHGSPTWMKVVYGALASISIAGASINAYGAHERQKEIEGLAGMEESKPEDKS